MNADEVRNLLRRVCQTAGSAAAWAKDHDLSPAYVSDTINKRRDPGPAILEALGIEAKTEYRKAQK